MVSPGGVTPNDPLARFEAWQSELDLGLACLATRRPDGAPAARMVAIRGVDPGGFVFFTDARSPKAEDLEADPRAALVFHVREPSHQVRVEGVAHRVEGEEARAYWATRPRESRLAALSSHQSAPLPLREDLLCRYEDRVQAHADADPPCPEHWIGYRIRPWRIEFWTGDSRRLHHREVFVREGDGWRRFLLDP